MAEFVDAYDKRTGEKARVPAHFFDVPSLSRHLSKTPRQSAADKAAPAAPTKTPAAGDKKE